MKKRTRTLGILDTIVVIIVIILVAAGEYFLRFALHHDHSAYNVEEEFKNQKEMVPWTAQWIDSIRADKALRDTFVTNDKGQRMHAWFLASPDSAMHNTAVIVHGYKSNSIFMFHIGYLYNHDLHWNILLPDLTAHGLSDGNTIQMGWNDRHDVNRWIGVAHDIFHADTLLVHGISMGGATTMCVAGDDQNRNYVRGFVDDCGYTSVWDEFTGELKNQFGLPSFPLMNVTSAMCKLQYGWSFKEASPLEMVKKCRKPMLFIHGDKDTYVPTAMVHRLYDAKQGDKQLWLAPGSEHANSYIDHHEKYTEKVKNFIRKYIH